MKIKFQSMEGNYFNAPKKEKVETGVLKNYHMTKYDFKDYLERKFRETVEKGRFLMHINDEWCLEISYLSCDRYIINIRCYGVYTGKCYVFKKKDYKRYIGVIGTWIWNRIEKSVD